MQPITATVKSKPMKLKKEYTESMNITKNKNGKNKFTVNIMRVMTIIVVICLLFSFTSCARDREYNEEEVLKAARELIKKSEKLNELYYGDGIAHTGDESTAEGYYIRADANSLAYFGVSTKDDIIRITRETFTQDYSNRLIMTKLESVKDTDDVIRSYARYYQKYSVLDETEPECLMVYKNAKVYLVDKVEYKYDTLRVSDVEGESIFVTLDVEITDPDKRTQSSTLTVELIEEANGFRINSPTYKRYDDGTYDELDNKNLNTK